MKSSEFKDIEKRKGKKPDYGKGVRAPAGPGCLRGAEDVALTAFARAADADLAALLQRELLACVDLYGELKSASRRARLPRPAPAGARSRARLRPVRRAFQERFKYILVDEFQDTDPLQAEILLLLAGQEARRTGSGSRLQVQARQAQESDSPGA